METKRGQWGFLILGAFLACCSAPQRSPTQSHEEGEADAGAEAEVVEDAALVRPVVDPAVAHAIRSLDWRSVNCTGRSELNRLLMLGFSPEQGWSCQVSGLAFADVTGDGIEEAIVSLDFQLTSVERQTNGSLEERRLRSSEHAVIGMRGEQPELLVHIVSDGGDISDVDVVDGDLRIELQGCWDCGCDISEEYWVWDGHRFEVDESRSRQLYEAPNCGP